MDNDFEIEITSETVGLQESIQLPINFLQIGNIDTDDVKVYIKQDIYKKIEDFAHSDTSKELGSIILGHTSNDLGKTHVVISEYIEAKYTDASASTLTFTHETWDYVHRVHEEKYSDVKILGWQHTHPNYGIFLSNYDMFIQENFFNLPFQVAYVVDPIQNIRGFFQWKNGKVEKLKGFYVYDDIGKEIKIGDDSKEERSNTQVKSLPKGIHVSLLFCFLLIITILGLSIFLMNKRIASQTAEQQYLYEEISTLRQYIESTQKESELPPLTAPEMDRETTNDYEDKIGSLEEEIRGLNLKISEQEKQLSDLLDKSNSNPDSNDTVVFILYKVERGDSLYSICKKQGIDYSANHKTILALNGISNADHIYAGQSIILPKN